MFQNNPKTSPASPDCGHVPSHGRCSPRILTGKKWRSRALAQLRLLTLILVGLSLPPGAIAMGALRCSGRLPRAGDSKDAPEVVVLPYTDPGGTSQALWSLEIEADLGTSTFRSPFMATITPELTTDGLSWGPSLT